MWYELHNTLWYTNESLATLQHLHWVTCFGLLTARFIFHFVLPLRAVALQSHTKKQVQTQRVYVHNYMHSTTQVCVANRKQIDLWLIDSIELPSVALRGQTNLSLANHTDVVLVCGLPRANCKLQIANCRGQTDRFCCYYNVASNRIFWHLWTCCIVLRLAGFTSAAIPGAK